DLSDQVAVVTGGGGILCSEMARALAECGAKVVVMSRRLEPLESVVKSITDLGGTAMAVSCDVTDLESLQAANASVEAAYGPCTIFGNGAGGNHPKGTTNRERLTPEALADKQMSSFFDLDPAGIRFVFDLNFIGTVLATQVFTRKMAEKGRGTVINV